jgi:DNA-binding MarR family transcriptional regulator
MFVTDADLSSTEYQALAEFRYQIRCFLRFSEDQARSSGLEPQQHQLLLAIRGLPEGRNASIRELASRLQLRHHSTVELVNRLESKGYIRRIPSETDRREVLLELTRAGDAVLRRLTLAHREELETAGTGLSKALRAVLKQSHAEIA